MTSRILHVSGDFPDPIEPFKTPVIKSFLELTSKSFDHEVVSINRTGAGAMGLVGALLDPQAQVTDQQPFDAGKALRYSAPGRGIFHRTMLERLGKHIADTIEASGKPVQLLVGHKLTIEGIAVAKASQLTGIPYALTIQGNTDRRILKARPDLRRLFRKIYLNASAVCTFTPIAKDAIESTLGKRADGITLIPCPTELDTIAAPKVTHGDVISVFHLKNHAVKNLTGLVKAASQVESKVRSRKIAILGGGSEAEIAHCKQLIASAPQIQLDGPVERSSMQAKMNEACVLVVPSQAESFGLVFVEALFAGLPIIYPKGTAIDGYFDGLPFAQGVDASSPRSIAKAIEQAINEEGEMKAALAQWQKSGAAGFFTRTAIASSYTAVLESALRKVSAFEP